MAEKPIVAVSEKTHLTVLCRPEEPILDTKGVMIGKKRRLYASFTRGAAPGWALDEAIRRFKFNTKPDEIPHAAVVGTFDSALARELNGWTDEEHDAVVRGLRAADGGDFIIVEPPKTPAPWASYDELTIQGKRTWEMVAEKNVQIALDTGVPLENVILYEQQNRNDPRLLEHYRSVQREQEASQEVAVVEA